MIDDWRFALRQLRARPWLSAFAILSLGLGIGATSAVFTIVNALVLRELPVPEPERLAEVYTSDSGGFLYAVSSYPDYRDYRDGATAFSDLSLYSVFLASHDDDHESHVRFGEVVSGNFFDVLRVSPAVGRFFTPDEEERPSFVVVLGHRFWQREFGGAPSAIGSVLKLNGQELTIVGVAPEPLQGSYPGIIADYWIPISIHDALSESPRLGKRGSRSFFLKGRLKPDAEFETAQAQLATIARRLATAYPDTNENRTVTVVPSTEVSLNPGIDGPVLGVSGLILGVVFLVLLIACSNIAMLLLARANDRRKEIAIGLVLGAGRFRTIRQLLTEGLLISLLGGFVGFAVAHWSAQAIMRFQPPLPITLSLDLGPDSRVLFFTAMVSVVCGLACALGPALQSSHPDLVPALKDEARTSGSRLGLKSFLVVLQVMLSTVLLVGAGLFLRSLMNAQSIDPGFSMRYGVIAQLPLGLGNRYTDEKARTFVRQLNEQLRGLPGVTAVTNSQLLPLGVGFQTNGVQVEGKIVSNDERDWPEIAVNSVGDSYFETLGIGILRGRPIEAHDGPANPRVVVVNEAMGKRYWPGDTAIGKRVRFDVDSEWYEVVGVARDGKYFSLGEEQRPFIYRSFDQDSGSLVTIAVRAESEASEATLLADVRATLTRIDPTLPLFDFKTMSQHLAIMVFPAKMGASLLSLFGALGLLLASLGLYGVIAYTVSRRTRELGIRMALGAGARDLVRLVVKDGMRLVTIGLVLGLVLASFGSRLLSGLLYGVSPSDPITLFGVGLVLAAVAFSASAFPASRAARLDPIRALRAD